MVCSRTIFTAIALILLVLSSVASVLAAEQVVEVRFIEKEEGCSGLSLFCYIKSFMTKPRYTTVTEVTKIKDEPITKTEIKEDLDIKNESIIKNKETLKTQKLNLKNINLKKFDPELIEKLERGEDVEVWVRTDAEKKITLSKSRNVLKNHPGLKQKYNVGYVGKLSLEDLEELEDNPDVIEVIENGYFYLATNDVIPLINADDVQQMQIGGEYINGTGQNICIIDSGIDYTNIELGPKYIGGYDFIDDDDDPLNLIDEHGTVIAGIAGRTAPGSKLVAVRACDETKCEFADIGAAVEWCNNNRDLYNISVIQMSIQNMESYTEYSCPHFIDNYLEAAYNNNILNAICSGNQGSTTGVGYPSCSPYAMSVGGTNKADGIYSMGNRGPNLDIMAPAVLIRSVYFDNSSCLRTGTSVATPFVSGAAALIQQFAKLNSYYMSAQDVENVLKDTGVMIYDSASNLSFPRLDVLAAITELNDTMACIDTDGDKVCDSDDDCVGENQSNIPSNTACATYTFDRLTGCHDVTYEPPITVCGAINCPDDQCVGKDWYEYTSMETRFCDGAGTCMDTTCTPSIWPDNLYCNHDMSVDAFYINNTDPIKVGDIVTAVKTFSNRGANTERLINYTLRSKDYDYPYESGTLIAYPPGTTRTGYSTWIYSEPGDFNVTLIMDHENALTEYNETNNQMSFIVHVIP